MNSFFLQLLCQLLAVLWALASCQVSAAEQADASSPKLYPEFTQLVCSPSFADNDTAKYWLEGPNQVSADDGVLTYGQSAGGSSLFFKKEIEGDFVWEFELNPELPEMPTDPPGWSNLLFFLCASHPEGLQRTADQRPRAAYRKYHVFPNYTITYQRRDPKDPPDRVIVRKNPGFKMLQSVDVTLTSGLYRRITIAKIGNKIELYEDDTRLVSCVDEGGAHAGGHLGLRAAIAHEHPGEHRVKALFRNMKVWQRKN